MRNEFWLALWLALLIGQASTSTAKTYSPSRSSETGGHERLAKRKLSTQQHHHQPTSVDYDPKRRTALLDINLERTVLGSNFTRAGWRRRSVNNFKVEVLRWPGDGSDCPAARVTCYSHPLTVEAATVVQSRRICWTRFLDSTTGNVKCDQDVPVDWKRASVLLEHIYTGCYCFRLAFYHDDSIRIAHQLLERPIYLRTDVTEYDVFKWNLSLDLSASGQPGDLSLFIKLDADADAAGFLSYHVELFRHDDIDADLMVCHETDDPINNRHLTVTFEDEEEEDDDDEPSSIIDYLWQEEWSVITFANLSAGYYCVVVVPDDDRCHPPLIDPEKTCTRYSNIVQLSRNPGMVLTYRSNFSTTLAYWVTGSVVILLALSVVIYLLLRRKMFPRLSLDDFNSTAESGLLRENPSSSTGVIPILFLYSSRSMSRLARHVSHLKEAIRNYVPNSLILDDADDEDLAIVEGVEWFSNHLQVAAGLSSSSSNNIRVVIILCPEMLRCQERFLRSRRITTTTTTTNRLLGDNCHRDGQMDQDDDLDPVCCYRLNQLLHHIDGSNVYRQVFAVRFDDDVDLDIPGAGNQSGSFCLLTPYRSYHWPGDQTALLAELGRQGYSNGHRQDDDVCQSPSTK
ncbi:uncharacterized protein LOC124312955 [Daphnia pulicaria]|uniref:uncharacterized protein LOC124312955 n=1 Tax=Daphnia pulicaria TaxID=35523 RepID=UPI001EEBEA73|nr:uncharacterized protein LOC124312955 [Daphnia pulicaria]